MLEYRSSARCVLTALTVTLAGPAAAQTRLEVGALLGLYAPASSFQPASYYSTALPNSPSDLAGLAWGGQGRLWLSLRFGMQLQVASASSNVGGGNTPGGPAPATPARVLTTSAQLAYKLLAPANGAQVWCSAGPGLVRHGGPAYSRYGSPTQFATAFGLGSAVPISSRLSADFGLTTFLYNLDVSDSTGASLEHGFQVDPLLHAGITLHWP